MDNSRGDNSLGTGVYYAEDDYIGLGKQMLILLIDCGVLALAIWINTVLWYSLPPNETTYTLLSWGLPLFVYVYLTIIKGSKLRTLGYRLVGAKILTLRGQRPSFIRMTYRLFLWLLWPINVLVHFFWAGIDEDRQSIRDRIAGTCVLRKTAVPIGEAPVHLAYYQAFGLSLMLPTVCRPRSSK